MFRSAALAAIIALGCAVHTTAALAQASQVPAAEQCFQATTGISGMIGALGFISGGSGGANGTYPGVALSGTQGGTGATATVVVSGGAVTAVTVIAPGVGYFVGDNLSALPASIGGVTGFSVPLLSTSINSSLAGGAVGMYIPGTLTTKQTWKDAAQTILNSNPIQLDLNGCSLIYGAGTYRQILYDRLGNEVWDQPTTVKSSNAVYAGLAGGTANAIAVTDTSFSGLDGQSVTFLGAITNTGATTLNPSGFGPISIVKNASSGPVALVGGEIIGATPGNIYTATYSSVYNEFFIGNPLSTGGGGTAIPAGLVAAFALTTCPTGWVNANGTGSTVNMLGAVARGYDPTNTRDPNGSAQSVGSFEAAMMATHTMGSAGGLGFVLNSGGGVAAGTGAPGDSVTNTTGGVINLPAGVSAGNDERAASTVLLYCQKS